MASNPSYRTVDATVPAHTANAVTKSDSTTFNPTRGVYVGGAGNIKVDMAYSGTAITFTGVLAGSFLPIQVTRIYSTGTTATDMVALY